MTNNSKVLIAISAKVWELFVLQKENESNGSEIHGKTKTGR